MREGFDKEIDSLLRRSARALAGARGNGVGTAKPDTHLDADELAAFAEGALPEAARLNAVSHLADCGECRSLAVNLTSAAGVEAKLEKHALAAAASPARESVAKRSWLAAIFAPRTLSYVVPALAVCLVAVVSFIALRSRSGSGLVSLRAPGNESASSPSIATSQNSSQPPTEGALNSNASSNTNTATTTQGTAGPTLDDKSAAETHAPEFRNKDVGTDAPDGSAPGARAESKAAGEAAAAPPPPPAKEKEEDAAGGAPPPREAMKAAPVAEVPAPKSADNTKAGPPPAQANDELAYNNEAQQQQRGAQKRGLEPQSPDGGARQRSAANNASSGGGLASTPRDDKDARSRRAENAPPATRRSGRGDQITVDGADRENTSEESRSVAGHRFRRERGAWVDVNYKSTMSSMGVRRGTDAYRALVADNPEIGRVAEQLGGEVLVVIRGRAYRIR
ncbi:MAG TPA: hypothetical protein VGP08_18380 [Pyrinomonadaceae bacterium]|jgi:hypothetical protein|nr:hypothetical protein [Pyrinomonadaceae bacterium]